MTQFLSLRICLLLFVLVAVLPLQASTDLPVQGENIILAQAASGNSADAAKQAADKERKVFMLKDLQNSDFKQSLGGRMMGLVGCFVMLLLAFLLSTNRKAISWRLVGFGLALQFGFALFILKSNAGSAIFEMANDAIMKILSFSNEGARFLFGNLVGNHIPVGRMNGSPGVGELVSGQYWADAGAMFAFGILPTIVFFSALTAVLYHLRILEYIVRAVAWVMQRTMKTSGAESFSAAANIFVGQTEAPLLVRPFLAKMTNSEIMTVMSGGFATVAGGVLAAYVGILMGFFPDIAGHLLAASVMSAPASLVMAKIMWPETEVAETATASRIKIDTTDSNILDAASRGTSDGLMLALNVGAMLIAFTALIAFINWILSICGGVFGLDALSLELMFSWLFAPIAFVIGVPWEDCLAVGALLGTKTAVNELVAYLGLAELLQNAELSSPKSVVISIYALCGFSNFASIGIQIGGLSSLAPSRRKDFAKVGLRAMVAGTLACFQTAAIAGILL